MRSFALLMLTACAGDPEDPGPGPQREPYPLDDLLRFDHLQALGTHNSYHVETTPIVQWQYTHAPLGVQLGEQGVRQFELDVSYDAELGAHSVFHVELVDEGTTCPTFVSCAADLKAWSDSNPGHQPLMILVETKDLWDPETGPAALASLDAELRSVWPDERLVTPARIQRDHPDLRTALAEEGWPTLGELRGTAMFVLHSGGDRRDFYVQALSDRPMMPDASGDETLPYAAVHTMNEAFDPRIAEVVALGQLVRTRADSDTEEARSGDTTRRDAAFASGAHWVSTDFPAPVDWTDYVVQVPGGTPSRCNPVSAPAECESLAVEDPDRL